MKYHCEYCSYEGHCYGSFTGHGVTAPWCTRCGRNNGLIPLDDWHILVNDERELGVRQHIRRKRQLFVVSVIIAAVCAAILYIGVVAAVYGADEVQESAPPAPRQEKQTRPQRCAHLLKEHDPEDWDPETETYPANWAWRECMGIA